MEHLLLVLKWPLKGIWSAVRWLGKAVGAVTIQPILEQAHRYHLDLKRWQRRWIELTRCVDTQLLAASPYTSGSRKMHCLGQLIREWFAHRAAIRVPTDDFDASSGRRHFGEVEIESYRKSSLYW